MTRASASATQADHSRDVVVGDAFGSLSVPWHLATREFIAEVDRVLRPEGVWVQNVIDYPTFQFARAELATLRERFEHVYAIAPQADFDGSTGGNLVLVASHRALDRDELSGLVAKHGDVVREGAALDRFIGDAPGDHRRLRPDRPVAPRGHDVVTPAARTRAGG